MNAIRESLPDRWARSKAEVLRTIFAGLNSVFGCAGFVVSLAVFLRVYGCG